MKTCMIRINIGDRVLYNQNRAEWIPVTILDMVLVPNGINNPELVCAIYAQKDEGGMVNATSDKFKPIDEIEYEEFYPTPHMFKVNSGQQ